MANYTTGADLVDDILFRAGEQTDASSDYYQAAIRYLNRAYQAIWRGGGELLPDVNEDWVWMRQLGSGILTLLPLYNTGTVSVTAASDTSLASTLTFSVGPTRSGGNISLANYHIKIADHADVFRIVTHVSGAVDAVLDGPYTGTTVTNGSFTAFRLDYPLATGAMNIIGSMRAYQGGISPDNNSIKAMAEREMMIKWPLEQIGPGVPQNFAPIAFVSGIQWVRFSHYGGTTDTELTRIDYDYIPTPADLDDNATEPLVPREYRKVLADWALFFLLQDKEDSRAQAAMQVAASGLRAMALQNRRMEPSASRALYGTYGRIFPREMYRRRAKGPLRTSGGLLITSP